MRDTEHQPGRIARWGISKILPISHMWPGQRARCTQQKGGVGTILRSNSLAVDVVADDEAQDGVAHVLEALVGAADDIVYSTG